MKKYLFFTTILMLTVNCLFAQINTASIAGTILDELNEPLPGASIIVKHTPSDIEDYHNTAVNGQWKLHNANINAKWKLSNLQSTGTYSIQIKYIGYKDYILRNVKLTTNRELKLDIKMVPDLSPVPRSLLPY